MAKKKNNKGKVDPATKAFEEGVSIVYKHPLFSALASRAWFLRKKNNRCPEDGWAVVSSSGQIHVHPTRRAQPEEWAYVIAHCLLHLGFGHFKEDKKHWYEWNKATDAFIARFLSDLKFGRAPQGMSSQTDFSARDEEKLYQQFVSSNVPDHMKFFGTAGAQADLLKSSTGPSYLSYRQVEWEELFGRGLSAAVSSALEVASGDIAFLGDSQKKTTAAERAKKWFMGHYPLLGSLASTFEIIEDPQVCVRMGISVAAVDPEMKEIYMNPAANLSFEETKFVMAHELLHVGLRHLPRRHGRDPFLWNAACDYVINGWLHEMKIGSMPDFGLLYDPEVKGLSSESIYDMILEDARKNKRLATFKGIGEGDILERGQTDWWLYGSGVGLDEFYRRALAQGLLYHQEQGRGFLPAGLVEEIRSLTQPPIPWDVELAQWFDEHFPPVQKVRSYARPSRRQGSTPNIPRPRYVEVEVEERSRTFGVVLDTSGSMSRKMLGKALGAIASYSVARDVPAVRLVYVDAAPYDEGYISPEDILEHAQIKGRGGTVLQPAINLLEKAEDFPDNAPILVITDGWCDKLRVRRDHAYLLPKGNSLPFSPKGPVFLVS